MKKNNIRKLVVAAMMLAIALLLPYLTGQIPEIGSMLCPMHLPVLLCGFLCGPWWGLAVGAVAAPLRFVLLGMPKGADVLFYGCGNGGLRLPRGIFI